MSQRALVLALLLSACSKAKPGGLAGCEQFTGSANQATWSGCGDSARREVLCRPGAGKQHLTCDCLVDGVKGTFFFAVNPPLESRVDATRVALANCDW